MNAPAGVSPEEHDRERAEEHRGYQKHQTWLATNDGPTTGRTRLHSVLNPPREEDIDQRDNAQPLRETGVVKGDPAGALTAREHANHQEDQEGRAYR